MSDRHPRRGRVTTVKRGPAVVKRSSAVRRGASVLLTDVRELILTTRQTVAQGVNSALVLLYWQIGQRIRTTRQTHRGGRRMCGSSNGGTQKRARHVT